MILLTRTVAFLLVLLSWVEMASAEANACLYRNLLAAKGNATLPLEISELSASSMPDEPSLRDAFLVSHGEGVTGVATVVNKSKKKILYFLLVVEFAKSATGKVSVPLFNVDASGKTTIEFDNISWLYGHGKPLIDPLPPEQETHISFSSPEVLPACPRKASLSVVKLKYEDGSTLDYESDALNLPPVLLSAPLGDIGEVAKRDPLAVFGTIHIDRDGKPTMFSDLHSIDPRVEGFLALLTTGWRFSPAVVQGRKSESHLPFILSIGDLPLEWNSMRSEALSMGDELMPIHILPPSTRYLEQRKNWGVVVNGRTVPGQ